MPAFFLPHVDPDKQEEAYRNMAALIGAVTRDVDQRIYSITWKHKGVEWTATVGEKLSGVETIMVGKGRQKSYRDVPRRTDDTVLAIYAGAPYLIMHDNKTRIWNVPIYTGEPSKVVRFG